MHNNNFLLRNIKNLINSDRSPDHIIKHFHNIIAKRQEQRLRQLTNVLALIEKHKRIYGVNTGDETIQKENVIALKTLSSLEKELRDSLFREDDKFMNSLRTALNYNFV